MGAKFSNSSVKRFVGDDESSDAVGGRTEANSVNGAFPRQS